LRRASVDPEDLFHAHIGAFDAFALAYKVAKRIIADGVFDEMLAQRYASYDEGFGRDIAERRVGFKELERLSLELGEPTPRSGRQEYLENLLMHYVHGHAP
jgi:xylose isomerase